MSTAFTWLSVFTFLFGAAAGIGYLRWARSNSAINTIKLLNDEIHAQSLTIGRLDSENKVLSFKLDQQAILLKEQSERLLLLTELVRGVPAWETLKKNYATLELAIKSLDPVITVFQKHVDDQNEMHLWWQQIRDQVDRLIKEGEDARGA